MAVITFLLQSTALRPQTQSCLQGLCTCCSLHLEHSSRPNNHMVHHCSFLIFIQIPAQISAIQQLFFTFFPHSFFSWYSLIYNVVFHFSVQQSDSYIDRHTVYQVLSHYRLLQDSECSSLHHSSFTANHFINSIMYLLIPNS